MIGGSETSPNLFYSRELLDGIPLLIRHWAIPMRLPAANTPERSKMIPGDINPTILSFLYVFNANGNDSANTNVHIPKTSKNRPGQNSDVRQIGNDSAISAVSILST